MIRVFSFGGGVQSHAVLLLQALGRLPEPFDVFAFANVGNNSENPQTLEYLDRITRPFAEQHRIMFIEVQKNYFGQPDTLYDALMRDNKSVEIPAYMGDTGAPGNRSCTEERKINVVDAWAYDVGNAERAVIGLGISTDEVQRVRSTEWHQSHARKHLQKRREYPLVQLGMSRRACLDLIAENGLPQPPKSSCYFCPFHRANEWIEMKRNTPALFAKAVEVEQRINQKREGLGKDRLYLHRSLTPLDQAVGDQLPLFAEQPADCDSGYCWT